MTKANLVKHNEYPDKEANAFLPFPQMHTHNINTHNINTTTHTPDTVGITAPRAL